MLQQPANNNRRIRILIVEDNPVDLKMIGKSCERYGLKCELLHMDDGAELVRYLRELDADPEMEPPDIALLDVHLPNYDGVELVDRIKASKRCGHMPVILMSNTLRPEDRPLVENIASRFFEKAVDYDAFMKIGAIIQEELML
jgi:CheY-like chemotaxis protein